uniref:Ig-like domain-containing protein n=1 Tax=Catagonus wagneri TaxID=51154 RepID=A0A8C3WJT4_9CETA
MLGCPACFILFLLCQLSEYLSKPKVTIGLQNSNNGTCVTNLTCSVEEGGEDVTYSWKSLGQANNESYDGFILPISLRREKRDMTFICLAKNPISSNSSNPIFPWKLCKASIEEKRGVDTHPEVLSYRPPSGETPEYDTIPHLNNTIPDENSINTLYSTVQIPPKVEKPHPLPTLPDTPKLFTYENII